jgi:hypothetical protein
MSADKELPVVAYLVKDGRVYADCVYITERAASESRVIAGMARDEEGRLSMGDANEDCSAATRRAIVRAAAQIGAAATGGRE